ncbi:MAG: PadR family transcriptional regulator [Sedimentisphaerales bacterium]|nr:PadR family transcriptional regulator [Sedimentisphaerales bacterium]NLT76238.1 PadR family transcriptional regulator [Planctomycetota bacterium]
MSNSSRQLSRCICTGRSLDRMLRPAILTVLHDQSRGLHGYAIEKHLQVFAFFQEQLPDYTGLYRLLKRMEAEGLLSSTQCDSQAGPSKRMFRLTDKGRRCLSRWFESLTEYRRMLDDLLEHIGDSRGATAQAKGTIDPTFSGEMQCQ